MKCYKALGLMVVGSCYTVICMEYPQSPAIESCLFNLKENDSQQIKTIKIRDGEITTSLLYFIPKVELKDVFIGQMECTCLKYCQDKARHHAIVQALFRIVCQDIDHYCYQWVLFRRNMVASPACIAFLLPLMLGTVFKSASKSGIIPLPLSATEDPDVLFHSATIRDQMMHFQLHEALENDH